MLDRMENSDIRAKYLSELAEKAEKIKAEEWPKEVLRRLDHQVTYRDVIAGDPLNQKEIKALRNFGLYRSCLDTRELGMTEEFQKRMGKPSEVISAGHQDHLV